MANQGATQAHHILRILQVLTLIPAWALMAAAVSWYNSHNIDTHGGVLTLFIVTLLASIWAFCILIAVLRARNTALWITFWDIIAMGALIAGVATTSNIANYQCNAVGATTTTSATTYYITENNQRIAVNPVNTTTAANNGNDFADDANNCNMIKAAWGLAIANIIMFFITAILAVVIYRQNMEEDQRDVIVEERRSPIVEKVYEPELERPRRARRHHRERRPSRGGYYYEERV